MKVTLIPQFTAGFMLDPASLEVLMQCSAVHYDTVCRSASAENGFIKRWQHARAHDFPCSATFHQLDICLKCLEHGPVGASVIFKDTMRRTRKLLNNICDVINARYKATGVSELDL